MPRRCLLVILLALFTASALTQETSPDLAAADQLYRSGKFAEAADSYAALIKTLKPTDGDKLIPAQAGLSRSLLRQNKVEEAFDTAQKALAAKPDSATLLAVMGDVQFRRAHMAEAEKGYLLAEKADPKEFHAYLGLAHLYRAYSLYRRAYDQLLRAHELAPDQPEVQRVWLSRLPRAERIAAIEAYLAKPHPDDEEENEGLRSYLDLLKATADRPPHYCKLVSKVDHTDTNLEALLVGPQQIRGYGLTVKLNDHNSKLLLDTGASGLLLSRKTAEKAGLVSISDTRLGGIGDKGRNPGHFAVADHIHIGELEFSDCIVRISEQANITDRDGLIGADVFGSYLIDIDIPGHQLRLTPLPKRPDGDEAPTALATGGEKASGEDKAAEEKTGEPDTPAAAPRLPRDRYIAPEMQNWSKVFRFGHMLLLPTFVNDTGPRLFLVDTGAFANTLSTATAREVTKVYETPNFHVKGISGSVAKVYSADHVKLQFGKFVDPDQPTVTFDLSNISKNAGTEIGGILGFRMLRMLEIKIDYRDGLVDFNYDPKRIPINNYR